MFIKKNHELRVDMKTRNKKEIRVYDAKSNNIQNILVKN